MNWAHECVYKYCITKHTLNVITQLHSYSGLFLYLTVRKILCWTQASGSYIRGCCVLLVPCFFALLCWGRCLTSLTSHSGSNGKMLASARQCTNVHFRLKMLISSSGQQMQPWSSAPQRLPGTICSWLFCDAHGVVNKESPRRKGSLISNRYGLLKWHMLWGKVYYLHLIVQYLPERRTKKVLDQWEYLARCLHGSCTENGCGLDEAGLGPDCLKPAVHSASWNQEFEDAVLVPFPRDCLWCIMPWCFWLSVQFLSVNCTCVRTYALSSRHHKMVGEIFFVSQALLVLFVCLFIIIFALNHNVEFWSLI